MKLPKRAPCQEAAGLLAWNGPEAIPVPATAPHRRIAEPAVVAEAHSVKGAKLAHRAAHAKVMVAPAKPAAKQDVKVADKKDGKADDKRKTAVIDVAAKPAAKGTVQLTAARNTTARTRKSAFRAPSKAPSEGGAAVSFARRSLACRSARGCRDR